MKEHTPFSDWLQTRDNPIVESDSNGSSKKKEEPDIDDIDVLLQLMQPGNLISLGTERYNGKCVHSLGTVLGVSKNGVRVQPMGGEKASVISISPASLEEIDFPPSFKRQLKMMGQHMFWQKKAPKKSAGSSAKKSAKSKPSSSTGGGDLMQSISDLLMHALGGGGSMEFSAESE